ncbi:MAG: CaiB/BaiF CoA transferase family protein [Bradyrhizobium sp.]
MTMLGSMKVVSFCHVLQGPACTQYLGDMGAEIIKIEPLEGERARRWAGPYFGDASGLYLCAFRNKRCLAIDLKSPEGLEIVLQLIDQADVVVENYRSGVMERLGLSYETIRQRKPDIIYASGTGWGRTGPMLKRPAQDILIQARTGLAFATGQEKARAAGSAIIDQHGGALLAMGIVAAYVKKLTTGQGTLVEGSLFAAGLDIQTEPLTVYLSQRPGAAVFDRDEHLATWYHQAPYGIYRLLDAEIAMSVNDPMTVADALDSTELRQLAKTDRFAHRDYYSRTFAKVMATRRFAAVERAFDSAGIWYSKVFSFDEVAEDPQAEALGVFRQESVGGVAVTLVNHPLRYDGEIPPLRVKAVRIGENTREILSEMGLTGNQIDDLVRRRVVRIAAESAGSTDLERQIAR